MTEHPLVATARELERHDAELAARIEELTRLEAEIAELRADVAQIEERRLELPIRRERLEQERGAAELEVARRQAGLDAALASSDDRDAAARSLATATTALDDAKARVARLNVENEQVEHEAATIEAEADRVIARAQPLATRVGVEFEDEIEQWAARARAAVFAERTHAGGERASVQEEAAELAAAVTGSAIVGDVPRVRRAVEAALR